MPRTGNDGAEQNLYRIAPYHYIHVLDQNTNVTRVEAGPLTFIRQDNEKVVLGPEPMVTVPPRNYCIVENPVLRGEDGAVVFETGKGLTQQAKLRHADKEIRLSQEPFALFPGEVLIQTVTPLTIVTADAALRLACVLDFTEKLADGTEVHRVAGDEWLFEGPGTYIPKVEVDVVETVVASIIGPNQALRVQARKECKDREGHDRVTGEEWLVKKVGAYLPGVFEVVVDVVNAYVLTEKVALHMRSTRTFKDANGITRRTGEEWLITFKDCDTHIPEVSEEVVGVVNITTLSSRQYAVIMNPCDAQGKPQLGQRRLIKGPSTFFLRPGETLEKNKIQDVYVLGEDEGLILKAIEAFHDDLADVDRSPGDRWMIRGPMEYVPPVQTDVVTKREAIPLDSNEGIYVRDVKSGKVRAVIGETYMLSHNEELWQKKLSPAVETLLAQRKDPLADRGDRGDRNKSTVRDYTRVITFRVPHNAAVQIYDFKEKKARVVFGPELVMLGPDEQFTQLSLSGAKPKKPNQIKALCLLLGPDFCTDIITIETADHARLSLQLSYNWHFKVDRTDPADAAKLFSVPDFVGDLCKAVASRVRGAVASVQFDDFHKNSAKIIRSSVFGIDPETSKVRDSFAFPANNLYITSIDIQNVEPVDQRTRDALQKSVQLAIEITTNSQEATARHEAQRLEQVAKGDLERQKIQDEAAAEDSRKNLLELQALSAAVESSGQAKAEAQSRAEAAKIEGLAAVEQARLKAEAMQIESAAELERLTAAREAETKYVREQNAIEVEKAEKLMEIEVTKFKQTIEAIGADTIASIASAPADLQVKLLSSLGLQTTLITDGNSPINLFNTAKGLVGGAGAALSE